MPAATAAALPPDEPPADRPVLHGLRVGPKRAFSVTGRSPSSGVFVLPTTIAPASRRRRTCALSWSGDPVAERTAALAARQIARRVEEILHADLDAAERPRVTGPDFVRLGQSPLGAQRDERVQPRVAPLDRGERGLDQLEGLDLAGADERRLFDGAPRQQLARVHVTLAWRCRTR
jgi:hypothetical protein